jgi:hypothetical protein
MKLVDAKLFEISNKYGDFRLAHSSLNPDGHITWSKHRTFLSCIESDKGIDWLNKKANHRQQFNNEIILDKDEKPSLIWLKSTCDILDLQRRKYKAYFTGSKGYHIHIIDDKLPFYPRYIREQIREDLISLFECDKMKKSDNCLIAREDIPHWKTGLKKVCVRKNKDV